jgi:hypothetical protein
MEHCKRQEVVEMADPTGAEKACHGETRIGQ